MFAKLSTGQRVVLEVGLLAVALLAVYPPWSLYMYSEAEVVHSFLWASPGRGFEVDLLRLLLEWVGVVALTFAGLLFVSGKKPPAPPE